MRKVEFFKADDFSSDLEPHEMAGQANRILNLRGTVVYGDKKANCNTWSTETEKFDTDSHTALLIDIQPIARETAEDVLREMVRRAQDPDDSGSTDEFVAHFVDRAKAALEREGG